MSEKKIFLSYSRKDSVVAKKLVNDIIRNGGSIWMDQLHIQSGMRWDRAIETALDESSYLMVLLTSTSVDSDNVMDEVSYALDENKVVITIVLDNCKIPFRLRRFQHIDFTEDYESGLKQLLSFLEISDKNDKEVTNPQAKDPTKEKKNSKPQKPQRTKITKKVVPISKPKKPVTKKKTNNITVAKSSSEANSETECPHCKSKVTARDKSFVECPECTKLFFEDERDGNIYKVVKIGNQIWMADNFRYNHKTGSRCYKDKIENCTKYGRLYDWKIAKEIAPTGWNLPSNEEWNELIDNSGGTENAGNKLKSKTSWRRKGNGIDAYGFCVLPCGSITFNTSFDGYGNYSIFWTSSKIAGNKAVKCWQFHNDYNKVFNNDENINYKFGDSRLSVRYIKSP